MNKETFKTNICTITGETKQNKIAAALHISESKVSRWFSSDTLPTLDDLLYISKEYDRSIDWLVGNERDTSKKLSPYDICKMLVDIDTAYHLEAVTINGQRNYLKVIDDEDLNFPNRGKRVDFSHCALYFKDFHVVPSGNFLESCCDCTGKEINNFLTKYIELRTILSKGIISKEIFIDVVNSHLSKLSKNTPEIKTDLIFDDEYILEGIAE